MHQQMENNPAAYFNKSLGHQDAFLNIGEEGQFWGEVGKKKKEWLQGNEVDQLLGKSINAYWVYGNWFLTYILEIFTYYQEYLYSLTMTKPGVQ